MNKIILNRAVISNSQKNTVATTGRETKRTQNQAQSFLANQDCDRAIEMVAIPSGRFLMGSSPTDPEAYETEMPQHEVRIDAFYLSKYPITQAQWRAVAALPKINRSLHPAPSKFKGLNLPVENISWYEAIEFCDRLSQKNQQNYRLPTEAEWEYACRGGTTTSFHFGQSLPFELANYNSQHKQTLAVNHFQKANSFGLYDLHGNIYEWCADDWHENYQGAPSNGSAWLLSDEHRGRVIRGGFWHSYARNCRCAYRDFSMPDASSSLIGFRVARS